MQSQRVIIIGGSSGIGLATGKLLVEKDADVIVVGRNKERLAAALYQIGGRAKAEQADFTDMTSLQALFTRIGTFDHLVLAGSSTAAWGSFTDISAADLRQAFDNKLLGYWQSLQAALPWLQQNGSVVMLSGAASRTAMPGTAGLAAVNGAITQMAMTLAKELAPLRINAVSPGLIDTPAYDGMPVEAKRGMFEEAARSLPVGHTGTAEEVASAIVFLLENSFTTGALLDVDGGARMSL
jgi:Dehydrogenases with different specificities (related to short-chain alcohol dehydrogenases)